ncbi:FAD-binding oxidoreductase [Salinarimonas rosea]|uniref:FAD-binding oxidoreductase n=1 Tax=Salinarimonas rosea TaxID=552063 RepID=UPI00040D1CF3|nr:FAD-binding oxidoreductase [Salinarimonas rosea]
MNAAAPDAEAALVASLVERLGAADVVSTLADIEPHLLESRGLYRGRALAVVRPKDVHEVSFVLARCAAAGVPVVPQGGNTGLVGGGVPHGGVVLSLARLDAIRALDPLNATITVEAGVTLKSIQDAADEADRLFPLSLASEGTCQIGGNLATNAGGTGVLRYGNARDLVLGLEVVLADGRIWNGMKGLRKDNTGYDLKHLFIGSEGTLGVITAAVLKLYPKPKAKVTAFLGCDGPHAALKVFERLREEAGDQLTAFEYIPRFGLELVLKHADGVTRPLAGDHAAYALVELTSPRADAQLESVIETVLGAAIEDGLVEDATIGASEAQNAALWKLREMLSEVQGREGGSIKHDVSVPVSRVADFIVEASAACEAAMAGIRVCAFGHFGDGNIHFNLSQPVGMEKAAYLGEWERFNRIVHDIVHAYDGSIAAEHGVGLIKRDELLLYKDPVALEAMRAIKAALDPRDILNPGKVVALSPEAPAALPGR